MTAPEPRVMPRDVLRDRLLDAYRTGWRDHEAGIDDRGGEVVTRILAAVPSESDAGLDATRGPHDWACGGSPGHPDPLCPECQRIEAEKRTRAIVNRQKRGPARP